MLLEFKGGQWLKATNENHIIASSTQKKTSHDNSRNQQEDKDERMTRRESSQNKQDEKDERVTIREIRT